MPSKQDIIGIRRSTKKQNFLDVRDLINAIELISCNKTKSGIYNIASNNVYSNLELAKIIKTILKSKSPIEERYNNNPKDSFEWKVCTQKAKKPLILSRSTQSPLQ